jgi:predicted  nucleic acid-binding Zn-ribbon protein
VQINVDIFLNDPRTLPEHTNYYEDLDRLVAELAEVNDKIVEVDRMLEDCKNGN